MPQWGNKMTEDEAWDELERKQAKKWDTTDMAYRPNGLTVDENIINKSKWYQEGYEAGQRDEREKWDTTDMAHRSGGLTVEQEIDRLKDFNQRLVATAKELGAAYDAHEWDDAWSKMCKIIKEVG